MNGTQRIMTALARGIPDRVPHFELAYNEESIIKIARCFTKDLPQPDCIQRMDLESRVKLFDAVLLVMEELDVDGLTLRIFPETRAIDAEHYKSLKIFKHTDGNHWKIMEDLIEVGFDGIHPIQPQSLDLTEVKKQIGDRICLLGNIDCRETLVTKSVREVEEEVRRAIGVAGPGGGYILSSSNTIHPGVEAENYIAMVKATHEYGVYGTYDLS